MFSTYKRIQSTTLRIKLLYNQMNQRKTSETDDSLHVIICVQWIWAKKKTHHPTLPMARYRDRAPNRFHLKLRSLRSVSAQRGRPWATYMPAKLRNLRTFPNKLRCNIGTNVIFCMFFFVPGHVPSTLRRSILRRGRHGIRHSNRSR